MQEWEMEVVAATSLGNGVIRFVVLTDAVSLSAWNRGGLTRKRLLPFETFWLLAHLLLLLPRIAGLSKTATLDTVEMLG